MPVVGDESVTMVEILTCAAAQVSHIKEPDRKYATFINLARSMARGVESPDPKTRAKWIDYVKKCVGSR
jgi:hypothetical protein